MELLKLDKYRKSRANFRTLDPPVQSEFSYFDTAYGVTFEKRGGPRGTKKSKGMMTSSKRVQTQLNLDSLTVTKKKKKKKKRILSIRYRKIEAWIILLESGTLGA